MLIMIMIRLIEMMTKKIGSIYQNLLVKIIIIIMMMMMMPKIICVPQSQLLVLSAHLCPTTLKIGPHHTSQDNTLLLLLWFPHQTSQDTTPWLLLLFTHHKTPPYHNSIHTLHHINFILPHKYLHKMNSKRENVHIRSCGIVKTCSPLKTDFSKFHYIAFLSRLPSS